MMPGMGLRGRLALFFVAITVVPLTVAVAVLQVQIDAQARERAAADLERAGTAAAALAQAMRLRSGDLATDLVDHDVGAVLDAGDPAAAQRWLDDEAGPRLEGRADVVVLVGADGRTLARRVASPPPAHVETGQAVDAIAAASGPDEPGPPWALLEVREVRGGRSGGPARVLGRVVAGIWLDADLLQSVVSPLGEAEGAALVAAGTVTAAVGAEADAVATHDLRPAAGPQPGTIAGAPALVGTTPLAGEDGDSDDEGALLVVWGPTPERVGLGVTLVVLVLAVAAAAWLGWLLAGSVVAPVRRAADVARSVAGGDLSRTLEPTGGRELADLATALNAMSDELARRLGEVERSRNELRKSLTRLGSTLSSSLDLGGTLSVVVDTAMETLRADRAVLMLLTPEGDALYTKVGRGVGAPPRMSLHEGVAGHVVRTNDPVLLPDGGDAPEPAHGEPTAAFQVSVPLHAGGRVIGVLTLLRDTAAGAFSADDVDTIRSLAAQTSVAIHNVILHQQAQRQSLTDPLTGLWNFRYFQIQAERERNSAVRFARPLSLLIVDLDHFKEVNDRYGHPAGDAVLVEIARCLRDVSRLPDVVSRYGGEEFALLLPDTDYEGALATAERLRSRVADAPASLPASGAEGHEAVQVTVTCSVGVATFPTHADDVASLLQAADQAMYRAKSGGRNRVVGAEDRDPARS